MLLFIFDMDEVLYRYDWRLRMAAMTELTGLSLEQLRERWWHEDGEWAAEAGRFGSAESYLEAFTAALDRPVSEADWVRIRGSAMSPDLAAIDAARRAGELGQVTLLTNNGPLTQKYLRTLAPLLVDVFGEHLYTTSHYGARKPDPQVFERVLAAYETDAADAFFADDHLPNIEGARSVGIESHHFTNAPDLRASIEAFAAARASRVE